MADDDTSPVTRLRDTVRAGADTARHVAGVASKRDDLVGGAVRAGATGTEAVRRGVSAIGKKANQGVTRAAKNLTLGDYRDEVDAALMEATEVIAAQAVRIAALETELHRLKNGPGELAAPGPVDVETSSLTIERDDLDGS
ncbi:MAG: hypothetical protein JJE52_18660 [Acidimicrobiia bacterium]|nr:hypothetical protein [Acidimicrobiia bacterium]